MKTENWIRTTGDQASQDRQNEQHPITFTAKVQEPLQLVDIATPDRHGQWEHSWGSTKLDRWSFDDPPAIRIELHASPAAATRMETGFVGLSNIAMALKCATASRIACGRAAVLFAK